MAGEREIKAKEIINDIRSGLGDTELMHKYKLTYRGLQKVYKQLLDANIIDEALLEGRVTPQSGATTTVVARLPRKDLYVPIPVQDANNPDLRGIVTNLSERGLGIKGMRVAVDQEKRLLIRPDEFLQLSAFAFTARCRWTKPSDDPTELQAGFEIVSISQGELAQLKNLIETLEYMYR